MAILPQMTQYQRRLKFIPVFFMVIILDAALLCSALLLARDRGVNIGEFLLHGGIPYIILSLLSLGFIAVPLAFVVAIHARRYANQVLKALASPLPLGWGSDQLSGWKAQ